MDGWNSWQVWAVSFRKGRFINLVAVVFSWYPEILVKKPPSRCPFHQFRASQQPQLKHPRSRLPQWEWLPNFPRVTTTKWAQQKPTNFSWVSHNSTYMGWVISPVCQWNPAYFRPIFRGPRTSIYTGCRGFGLMASPLEGWRVPTGFLKGFSLHWLCELMVSFLQEVDGFKGDISLVNPNIRHYLFKGKNPLQTTIKLCIMWFTPNAKSNDPSGFSKRVDGFC